MAANQQENQFEHLKRITLPARPKRAHGWVLFSTDVIAVVVGWYAANVIYFWVPIHTLYYGPNRIPIIEILSYERVGMLAALLVLFARAGHYKDHIHYFFQLRSIFIACCIGLIGESVLRLFLSRPTSTTALFVAWGLTVVLIMVLRALASNIITNNKRFRQPTIIVSDGQIGQHAKDAIRRKPRLGFREAEDEEVDQQIDWNKLTARAIGNEDDMALGELKSRAAQTSDDMLFLFAFDSFDQNSVPAAIRSLKSLERPFGFITSQTGIRLPYFKEFPFFGEDLILLLPDYQGPSLPSRIVKRLMDIVISGSVLLVFAPLLLLVSILIRRDGGSIFFKHERIGRNGIRFECLKFRTMVVDAEAQLAHLLTTDDEARALWETHQKIQNDPRITSVGKHLRKGSLDELPQLINVLKGDMSIIGPRPCVEDQVKEYGKRFSSYLAMRPGITGLWQVSGRNQTTFEERAELEAWYVDNWSLWLDLFILLKTIPVVLLGRGAY